MDFLKNNWMEFSTDWLTHLMPSDKYNSAMARDTGLIFLLLDIASVWFFFNREKTASAKMAAVPCEN